MTSSVGSSRTTQRVETRSQAQEAPNARSSSPPKTETPPAADTQGATAGAEATPRPDPVDTEFSRQRLANDTSTRLQQDRLRSAPLNAPITLGGLGGAGGLKAQNSSPSLEQVAADTHVLQRGHRDLTPDGGVTTTQEMLNRVGAQPPLAEDGIFGPKTEDAVEAFQRANGLQVDGKVGDKTLAALEAQDDQRMRELVAGSSLPPGTQQAVLQQMDAAATSADRRGIYGLASSEGFRALGEADQGRFLEAAAKDPDNAAYTRQLETLAGDPEFRGLDEGVRGRTLEQLGKHTDDPAAGQTITDLTTSEGFAALSADEQGRMLDYVGANTDFVAPEGRRALDGIMRSPTFQGADAAGQAQQLRDFMTNQPGLPAVIDFPPGHMDGRRRDYTVSEPVTEANHAFRGSTEDALRYDVTVGDRTIPVYLPANQNSANGNFHSIDEIARGLAAMPDVALDQVTDVTINPQTNPEDPFWQQQYGDPNFRSYMTAGADGHITVYPSTNPISQDYLDSSLLHEVGHTVSHNRWGGDETQPAWQGYRDAIAADGLDVTQYGQNNPDEDFSEAFSIYMGVRGTPQEAELRAIYPNRFAIFDRIVQGLE